MPLYSNMKFPEYVFQEYPKWVGEVIVNSREEEDALQSDNVTPINARSEAAKVTWAKRKAGR